MSLVDAMGRIYNLEQARANRARWWTRIFCWSRSARKSRSGTSTPRSSRRTSAQAPGGLRRRFCECRSCSAILWGSLSSAQYITPQHRRTHPSFPKVRPHAPNTIQTPAWDRLTWIGRIKQQLWTIGKRLTERDTKYAVKAGMATAILAAPAFFDATRPYFVRLWGDWALISVQFSSLSISVSFVADSRCSSSLSFRPLLEQ